MKRGQRTASGLLLVALAGVVAVPAADQGEVTVYTNETLERMFGPPPPPPSDPVDKSTPADWTWVEGYLERQYARLDADRQYDLQRRTLDIAEERTYTGYRGYGYSGYGGYASLGLGYPASTWWGNVHRAYSGGGSSCRITPGTPGGRGTRSPTGSSSRPSPRSGGHARAKAP